MRSALKPMPSRRARAVKPRGAYAGSYADAVYAQLRHDILQGTLQPGHRLREDELCARYRVSRTPIREALNRLEVEGFVGAGNGRGLVVADVDEHEILEGYIIRGALEGVAARLAAQRATDVDLTRLDMLNAAIARAAADNDTNAIVKLSGEFHFHVWRMAGNRRLLKLMQDIENGMGRFQRLTLLGRGRMQHAIDEHGEILDAIRARDADRAEQLARDHMRAAQQARLEQDLERYAAPSIAAAASGGSLDPVSTEA